MDMLGPLVPKINKNGELANDGKAQPSLIDQIAAMRCRGDITKPIRPEIYHGTQEDNAAHGNINERLLRTLQIP